MSGREMSLTTTMSTPLAANFFRPSAPNYFLVQALTGLPPATFNALIAGTLRTPGTVSPFGSINAQVSDGNSKYNAMNLDLKKRFSHNFQFLASYTVTTPADGYRDNFINIVVAETGTAGIRLDGESVAASEFAPVGHSG